MPGRDYIYSNYDPAYTNTYIVKISNPPTGIAISEDLCYLAKSIAFQGETLNLVRDDFTKEFKLSGDTPYNWVNAVTITWNETSFWEIKQFHDRWMGMFYDKEKDVYLSGVAGYAGKNREYSRENSNAGAAVPRGGSVH